MFGKKKDFFGTRYTRYKNMMDEEKQKKLDEIKMSMKDKGKVNITELYLEKQKYFNSLINQRTILSKREAIADKKTNLINKSIVSFIVNDRLDAYERLKPALSANQIAWAEKQIEATKNKRVETPSPSENETSAPTGNQEDNNIEENPENQVNDTLPEQP